MTQEIRRPLWWSDTALLLWLALFKVLLHVATSGNYGYFRDELYYIACSDHLAWGYVDHPPLSIFILAATRAVLGDSLFAIRLPVALAGGAVVFLTGLLARELGGGRFAQFLAAISCLVMGVGLGLATFFSMNAFEMLFWVGCVFIVVRIIKTDEARGWLWFGVLAGLGMLNKISMGLLAFGIVLGLVLTPSRKYLLSVWLWLGGALAAFIFLPHVVWQIANGFPTLEFMRRASELKIAQMSAGAFLGAQLLYTNPATLPVWLGGLGYFLFAPTGKQYRLLGIAYVAVLLVLLLQHGKAYYLAPAYPMLMAGGGVAIERFSARSGWHWVRPALVTVVTLVGALAAPMAVPLLPPETLVRYVSAMGLQAPQEERQQRVALSQHFADRFGWDNMVATIARVYQTLPLDDRARSAIVAGNYGEAGAIDFLGPQYGLPKAISPHNNYWLWGPGTTTGEVAVVVGVPRQRLEQLFEEVTQAETIVSPYAMAYETNLPVYVCRKLKRPLSEVWLQIKTFI